MSSTGRSGDDIGDTVGDGDMQVWDAWLSTVTYSSPTSPRHIGHIFFLL